MLPDTLTAGSFLVVSIPVETSPTPCAKQVEKDPRVRWRIRTKVVFVIILLNLVNYLLLRLEKIGISMNYIASMFFYSAGSFVPYTFP